MKTTRNLVRTLALGLASFGCVGPAGASYDYTIGNNGDLISGFVVSVDGTAESGILVGGLQATATGQGGGVPGYSSFTTVCEDLSGRLYLGSTYSFNEAAFSGQTGLNPSWGNPLTSPPNLATAYQAINNAAFLFASHESLGSATDWAALQLAVWKAIYDTDANGNIVWGSSERFVVNHDPTVNAAAWTEAEAWLGALPRTQDYAGYVLKPTDPGGQELLIGVAPVPEPTTFVAGAFLILAFGVSTLRLIRERRAQEPVWLLD